MKQINYDNTNFTVYQNTLDCNLKVSYIMKKGFNKTYSILKTNYGSIDRKFTLNGKLYETPQGIAHFLEHKLFEMPDFTDAFTALTKMGAYSNAYTSNDKTAYVISTTDDILKPLKVMLEFVYTPFFDEKRVEDEKSIIESEILMYKDYYDYQLLMKAQKNLYHNSTLAEDIAGEVKDIKQVNKELLDICYKAFYTPKNMHLIICGDFDHVNLNSEINEYLNNFTFEDVKVTTHNNIKDSTILNNEFEVFENIAVDKYILGIKMALISEEQRQKEEIICEAINSIFFSKSSQLYQDLINKNLANDQYVSFVDMGKDYRYLILEGISEKVDEVKEQIKTYIPKLSSEQITDEQLDNFKKHSIGELYYTQNSLEGIVTNYLSFDALEMSYFDSIKIINELTKNDVLEYLKTITLETCVVGTMKKLQK